MHPHNGATSTHETLLNPNNVTFQKSDNPPCHLIYTLPQSGGFQRWRFVTIVWLGLTSIVCCAGIACLIVPSWFLRKSSITNVEVFKFGLYSYCVKDVIRPDGELCRFYDPRMRLDHFPGTSFAISFILFCAGSVLQSLVIIVNLLTIRLQEKMDWTRNSVFLSGYAQCISSALLLSSLIIFPMGLGEKMVQEHCSGEMVSGRTKAYFAGDCTVGWAYSLSCVIVAISLFLPFLARFSLKPSTHFFQTV